MMGTDIEGEIQAYSVTLTTPPDRLKSTASGSKTSEAQTINVTARLWPAAKRNSDGKKNAADLEQHLVV